MLMLMLLKLLVREKSQMYEGSIRLLANIANCNLLLMDDDVDKYKKSNL